MKETVIASRQSALRASSATPFVLTEDQVAEYRALRALGIGLDDRTLLDMRAALDANVLTPTTMAGTITTPVQFLQNWLPGLVHVVTRALKIDELVGISIGGAWSDEEVIQGILEPTGLAVPYGDYTNVPLASWNLSFERRSIVRFEQGIRVGRLEEDRASRVNVNSATEKRNAAARALEINRNRVGFYGYNGGAGRTFGFLNDPGLPAYVNVPAGTGGTTWATKTFTEIIADIRTAVGALQNNSGDTIDPTRIRTTLAVATVASQFLAVTTDFGQSVAGWLKATYPLMRVVTAPELNAANGGANVFYLYADSVDDGSTDGGAVFDQIVPTKFQTLGVEQQAKAYIEDYTNATGGVMAKRPWAIVRRSGI